MATDIVMPQLGLTMTEGTIVKWLKRVGDQVRQGDVLFEVETDKVTQEVDSLDEGTLSQIVVAEGATVPVGTVIAYLGTPGEKREVSDGRGDSEGGLASGQVHVGRGDSELRTQSPEPAPAGDGDFVKASPVARKLAKTLGIDLRAVAGTGPGGRIVEEDVRKAAAATSAVQSTQSPTLSPAVSAPAPSVPAAGGQRIELRGARRVVAERMVQSFTTAPHFYLTVEADASSLTTLNRQLAPTLERKQGLKLTITDWLIKAAATALREQPMANAMWSSGAGQLNDAVNVGLAVATPEGLVVVVIREADKLTLAGIARQRTALVEKARNGHLTLPDLEGGTFTLSNLGMYGIDLFEAIVNPPQAAILAVGRIKDRVVAVDGQVAVRPTTFVSLSSDHRLLDGAMAAQFLARVARLIEEPAEMLLSEAES